MYFSKKSKWRKNFLDANGRGLYQSTWYHPRNTLCKDCLNTPYGSWVISQNVKHVITDHMVALQIILYNMWSICSWATCSWSLNTLALLLLEIWAFKHRSHWLSIINFNVLKNYIKSMEYVRDMKSNSTHLLMDMYNLTLKRSWYDKSCRTSYATKNGEIINKERR